MVVVHGGVHSGGGTGWWGTRGNGYGDNVRGVWVHHGTGPGVASPLFHTVSPLRLHCTTLCLH